MLLDLQVQFLSIYLGLPQLVNVKWYSPVKDQLMLE